MGKDQRDRNRFVGKYLKTYMGRSLKTCFGGYMAKDTRIMGTSYKPNCSKNRGDTNLVVEQYTKTCN